MSSLKEKLLEDMKKAMNEGSHVTLAAIRTTRATIKNEEISQRKDLSDEEVKKILEKEIGLRREARDEYRRLGNESQARRLEQEIEVLEKYLSPPNG